MNETSALIIETEASSLAALPGKNTMKRQLFMNQKVIPHQILNQPDPWTSQPLEL